MPPPPHSPDDPAVFAVLDAYLEAVQAGDTAAQQRLLADHPELAGAMHCLDALDRLARDGAQGSEAPAEPTRSAPGSDPAPRADEAVTLPGVPPTLAPEGLLVNGFAGTEFGKYELLGEIGRGGMGVVYKARQKDLDRIVALKMIQACHLASPEQVSRFQAEAKAAARLHHPHVVSVYEVGQLHGQHYFAMQYIDGPSLADLLRDGPLPAERAARYLLAIARAVDHLHQQGIVHRDLKPSNILLDRDDQPYVTDFGLVKMLESDSHVTATGAVLGTPSYMAPEQAGGRAAQVGPLSDVYSLGAILYELLTGQPPFRGATPLDTLVQVLEGEPAPPRVRHPAVPRALEMVCLKCLEKAPEARYPSAGALADDLERFLHGEPVEARPHGAGQRLRRWVRREPSLAARLGLLTVCAGLVSVVYPISHHLSFPVYLEVMALLAVWALSATLFQRVLRREHWGDAVGYAWMGTDAVLLTVLFKLVHAELSPLIVCYALMVVVSGLWFRVRLVWFTTAISVAAYGFLVIDSYEHWKGHQQPHHHIIFAVALVLLGFMVAYQVQRVRALSRYYKRRPLP
jgi:serine/threonine-protein kinase